MTHFAARASRVEAWRFLHLAALLEVPELELLLPVLLLAAPVALEGGGTGWFDATALPEDPETEAG